MSRMKPFEHLKLELEALKSATNNFADENCIGNGGFGKVYKGELVHSTKQTMVAIKRLDRSFGQGNNEFWKEIILLSLYRHENIVSLLGFCDESDEKILVYKYASNKSLDLHLKRDELTWVQRLNICIGAARGLGYLHDPGETQQRVLHRDIKSSNILLDENWNAMISDFGLSKFGPANQQYTFLISNALGTIGYCDPVYVETGVLTKESDVYSFGVVLFEIMCGRLCVENKKYNQRSLPGLVRECYEHNKMREIIFDKIRYKIKPYSLQEFTEIAYKCMKRDAEERPLMTEVVERLERALRYQVSDNDSISDLVQENKMHNITGQLLSIRPADLQFPFEVGKIISCFVNIENRTNEHVAFKVKTTNSEIYRVRPNTGIVLPCSICVVDVEKAALMEAPSNMKCTDRFLIQSVAVSPEVKPEGLLTSNLFKKEPGYHVEEQVLKVKYIASLQS